MDYNLAGKSAIITGAGSGIGRGLALAFASQGASVTVFGRSGDSIANTARLITDNGGRALTIQGDVTSADDHVRAREETLRAFGRIDILHNNAGISPFGKLIDLSEEEWNEVLAINLNGIFLACKSVIPVMVERGGGVITNTAGTYGLHPQKNKAAYCVSKAGVIMLTRQLALEHGQDNIRVNCISPGSVDTPLANITEEKRDRILALQPIRQISKPNDIAKAALYLASDHARMVTGLNFVIDGGQSLV